MLPVEAEFVSEWAGLPGVTCKAILSYIKQCTFLSASKVCSLHTRHLLKWKHTSTTQNKIVADAMFADPKLLCTSHIKMLQLLLTCSYNNATCACVCACVHACIRGCSRVHACRFRDECRILNRGYFESSPCPFNAWPVSFLRDISEWFVKHFEWFKWLDNVLTTFSLYLNPCSRAW